MAKNPNVICTVVRIPKELYLAFSIAAKEDHRSINKQFIAVIEEHLEKRKP